MSRLELLLLPVIAAVVAAALLLERASAESVRLIAICVVVFLLAMLLYGGARRVRRLRSQHQALAELHARGPSVEVKKLDDGAGPNGSQTSKS